MFVLLILLLCVCDAGNAKGSASKLSHRILESPSEDPFGLLSAVELKKEWSQDALDLGKAHGRGLSEMHFVTVVLVGFDGDVSEHVKCSEGALMGALGEVKEQLYTFDGEALPVMGSVRFHVKKAHARVGAKLQKAIAQRLQSHKEPQTLSMSLMESVLGPSYEDLHSNAPVVFVVNAGRHRVGYSWGTGGVCNTVHYAAQHQRYLWVDINAGPLEWGPVTAGEGSAHSYGFPFLSDHYSLRSEERRKAFLAKIASYVVRSTTTLLLPSLSRVPRTAGNGTLTFVLISDDPSAQEGPQVLEQHQQETCAALSDASISCPHRPLALSLDSCAFCAAAVEKSRRFYSTHLGSAHGYLDSKELHHWLQRFLPHLSVVPGHSLPVVVLFTHDTFVLLDRVHQVVAFEDMVVAIVSSGSTVSFDYFCNSLPKQRLRVDTSNATRPLVSAILDTLHGVAPTHLRFEPEHGKVAADHAWAVGPTPSGMFSSSLEMGFFVRDQISRNAVVRRAWRHFRYLEQVLSVLPTSAVSSELQKELSAQEYRQVVQRWNVWTWKRQQLERELSLYSYAHALQYLESMHFDLAAINRLFGVAASRFRVERDCSMSSEFSAFDFGAISTVILSIALSGTLLYKIVQGSVFPKRKKLFVKDRLPRSAGDDFFNT